jgi:Family of unknown function (DUF6232)
MSLNNALQNEQTTTIEQPQLIKITKKTVTFGSDIYQFCNVTGFGLDRVKNTSIVPLPIIIFLFGVGGVLILSPVGKGWGVLILCLAAGTVFLNMSQAPKYGLKLYVNSGDNKIFVTKDLNGIKSIVAQLYEFMESDTEGGFIVNIDQSHVKIDQSHAAIGVGYAEKVRKQ